tara:strand:- start:49 stop:165 length:117 start_codon:yes stop_codon:yes gene_type:complete
VSEEEFKVLADKLERESRYAMYFFWFVFSTVVVYWIWR